MSRTFLKNNGDRKITNSDSLYPFLLKVFIYGNDSVWIRSSLRGYDLGCGGWLLLMDRALVGGWPLLMDQAEGEVH